MDPRTRLYLEHPDLVEFDASVVAVRPLADGGVGVVLDRTAFYPTSGGQPHDTGTLAGEPVVEVVEDHAGAILHRLARAPAARAVHGSVDATRRRDHMQQHSGQHLLSATCVALLGRDTTSFHLGTDRCTIDLPGPVLPAETLARVEQRANEIVWEGRPVRTRFADPEAAETLRKAPPGGHERLRLVEIEGWDSSACCGTHVENTSAIGVVKILGQEKWGSSTRLTFVCGRRALAACAAHQARIEALVRLLTCHPDELEERCAKLLEETRGLRKETQRLQAERWRERAQALLAGAARIGATPVVVETLEAGGGAALAVMAAELTAAGAVALLASRGERADLVFARPDALALDLRPAMQQACAAIGGRGGGPAARVQGAGPRVEGLADALTAAQTEVARQLQ